MGKGVMVESSKKVKPWRQDTKYAALEAKPADWDPSGPMSLSVVFRFQRPAAHYLKNGLRPTAPYYVTSARNGDLDKLLRSTCDAMTGILKRYCNTNEQPGAIITLTALNLTDQ